MGRKKGDRAAGELEEVPAEGKAPYINPDVSDEYGYCSGCE